MPRAYQLVGGRLGYSAPVKNFNLTVFTGVDNAFNAKYSLGNDINAAAGRYYNAAPTANYFIGLSINFNREIKK